MARAAESGRRRRASAVPPPGILSAGVAAVVILGIDPGLTRCGYAALEATGATTARAVALGVVRTAAADPLPARLAELRGELAALIAELQPDVVAVEHVFFQVNVRTAMSVGQASGLALAEAAAAGCQVVQYTPNQVKEASTAPTEPAPSSAPAPCRPHPTRSPPP